MAKLLKRIIAWLRGRNPGVDWSDLPSTGNLIVVRCVTWNGDSTGDWPVTVSDNKGNSYTYRAVLKEETEVVADKTRIFGGTIDKDPEPR